MTHEKDRLPASAYHIEPPTLRRVSQVGAVLFLTVLSASAALIDATPGGFDWNSAGAPPPAYLDFLQSNQVFFDEARIVPSGGVNYHGWVGQYGALNGGQYFFTDLFNLGPSPTAGVSWNFAG